jgi:hypothetical protein
MRKNAGMVAVALISFLLGGIAVEFVPRVYGRQNDVKKPTWSHGMSLRVRKAAEPDFNKDTKGIGIEMFRDENNGNLIYISENGSIAVLPGK